MTLNIPMIATMMSPPLKLILTVAFVLAVIGVIAYLVKIAPFIEATIKTFIVWGLLAVGAIYVIFTIAEYLGIA
jgi:hypothetical protein